MENEEKKSGASSNSFEEKNEDMKNRLTKLINESEQKSSSLRKVLNSINKDIKSNVKH